MQFKHRLKHFFKASLWKNSINEDTATRLYLSASIAFFVTLFYSARHGELASFKSTLILFVIFCVPFLLLAGFIRFVLSLYHFLKSKLSPTKKQTSPQSNNALVYHKTFIASATLVWLYLMRHAFLQIEWVLKADDILSRMRISGELHLWNLLQLCVCVAVFLMGRRFVTKYIKEVCLILCLMGCLNLPPLLQQHTSPEARNFSINPKDTYVPKLKHKPNIYFIILDSYTNKKGLASLGINNDAFYNTLTQKGFTLYHDFFSAYHLTMYSMPAYLDMAHHYYQCEEKQLRHLAAGWGRVPDILRHNGYRINLIHDSHYFLGSAEPRADFSWYPGHGQHIGVYTEILGNTLPKNVWKLIAKRMLHSKKSLLCALIGLHPKTPHFTYIHYMGWPGHSNPLQNDFCDEHAQTQRYAKRIHFANQKFLQILAWIDQHDPSAIVVLAGDHGPYIRSRCTRCVNKCVKKDTKRFVQENLNVLCAIRWPKYYDSAFDKLIKTSPNLFRIILSMLAEDLTLLEQRVPDYSFSPSRHPVQKPGMYFLVAKNGKVLDNPLLYGTF